MDSWKNKQPIPFLARQRRKPAVSQVIATSSRSARNRFVSEAVPTHNKPSKMNHPLFIDVQSSYSRHLESIAQPANTRRIKKASEPPLIDQVDVLGSIPRVQNGTELNYRTIPQPNRVHWDPAIDRRCDAACSGLTTADEPVTELEKGTRDRTASRFASNDLNITINEEVTTGGNETNISIKSASLKAFFQSKNIRIPHGFSDEVHLNDCVVPTTCDVCQICPPWTKICILEICIHKICVYCFYNVYMPHQPIARCPVANCTTVTSSVVDVNHNFDQQYRHHIDSNNVAKGRSPVNNQANFSIPQQKLVGESFIQAGRDG